MGAARPPGKYFPQFLTLFQEKYLLQNKNSRSRKFTPETLFRTLIHLCSGKNNESYLHALLQSFSTELAPVKNSLAKYRAKISYHFFKDQFMDLNNSYKRPKWKGVHLYGTDGFELAIPRTKEILKAGHQGRKG